MNMKYYLKIENNQIVEASEIIVKNGYTIYGYNSEDNEAMLIQDGYTAYPKHAYDYEIKDGKIVEKQPQPIPEKTTFTKLQIRRACRALELEQKLDELINYNAQFYRDWADAQQIDMNDELIQQAVQTGIFTAEEIQSIKDAINEYTE